MSLHPRATAPVPEETARIARAAFPKGTSAIRVRDALGPVYDDEAFAPLFSHRGRPAESPGRLALVSVLQFAEGLSDRQAADAVRGRIDWKYALGLELTDAGFDFSVLSEFRTRLVGGGMEQHLLDALLARAAEVGLLKARGRQRTDSSHVLSTARMLNRLEGVGETLRAALNALATVAPDWLAAWAPAEWFDRYGARFEDARLPTGDAARNALAVVIGTDGLALLTAVHATGAPPWLRELPAVEVLRRAWVHQFLVVDGEARWRPVGDLAPSRLRSDTPYDPEARYANKGATAWTGYEVHLTETCDADAPHLVTHVATTPAPASDVTMTARIHADLAAEGLLPAGHWVDANDVDADLLVASRREHGVELVGPVRPDTSWQAKAAEGYDVSRFAIDWDARTATCPEGVASVRWQPVRSPWGTPLVHVEFSNRDCRPARSGRPAPGPRPCRGS